MSYPLPNASLDLTGQVALVTGATAGLGSRFARVLASAGAKVAVAGRRSNRLDELVAEIQAGGGEAHAIVVDVLDTASLARAVADVEEVLGTVTILVNNAGMPDAQLATKIPLELIDQVFDLNVIGPFVLAREVARRLIEREMPGRVVNISSMAAFQYTLKGASVYSISKAAIARMTEVLAVEWAAANINVNCIAPGSFESEMMSGMIDRIGTDFIDAMPRQRLGNPAQLDSTLLYLCSPASDAVTGTIIKVDDGQMPR